MKERPIIFSGESVRAIIEDRKTQTRRVMKPQPMGFIPAGYYIDAYAHGPQWNLWTPDNRMANSLPVWKCPFEIGMNLWVRETYGRVEPYPESGDGLGWPVIDIRFNDKLWEYWRHRVIYRADGDAEPDCTPEDDERGACRGKWRPSIFMPRWASRLTLEVTGIRVQRVHEISEKDAHAEGIDPQTCASLDDTVMGRHPFVDAWDSINAKRGYGWDVNPWVWVIEFKRLTEAARA